MKLYILLTFSLLFFLTEVSAQEDVFRRFSSEPEKYPEELLGFMEIDQEAGMPEAFQALIQRWNDSSMLDTARAEIIFLSNRLLDKFARPRPHFTTFIKILYLLGNKPEQADNRRAWIESMMDFSAPSEFTLPMLQSYMMFTLRLLESGTVSQTNTNRWVSSNPEFRLEYTDSIRLYLESTDLTCYAIRDSIMIRQTGGVYNPLTNQWIGQGGHITWERYGYDGNRIYAEPETYRINLRFPDFRIDTVKYYNSELFDYAVPGSLEHKVERISSGAQANYPRFRSFGLDYDVNNVFENVYFHGGISMLGAKILGTGNVYKKARLRFLRNDTLVILARSETFILDPERLTSMNAEISLYIEHDSIYHPSTGMDYVAAENRISFFRTGSYQSEAPYHNSYHKVEMNFEQLTWKLDEDLIEFRLREGGSTGIANFQSNNLFDERTYYRIQGIDEENILVTLRRYSERVMDITFRSDDFARYARIRYNQLQQMLIRLTVLGFINFDLERELITLRQKLYDWIYASVNTIDYDVIDLRSETVSPKENASLDLRNNDLHINGLEMIRLSNAQSVFIFPKNKTVTMKRNRDFVFDGVINAGLLTFHGKNFLFSYDDFRIKLTDIDSLSLKVQGDEVDAYGQVFLIQIQSILQDMSGELLIDNPENKSGRRDYASYPVFRSSENSFIYYDDPSIQKGVYTRDHFYFEVYPFIFDSLDNFDRQGLDLKGKLHSAGIFPDFEHRIYVQPDNSLGFVYQTGPEGFELYRGKGHYSEQIRLSNEGLRGTGGFTYLTSRTRADDVVFHPDSLMTNANEFNIQQKTDGVQYPLVSSRKSDLLWYPYRDTMMVDRGESPFVILNDSTQLTGSLVLTPVGLTGKGRMDLTNSVLESDKFTYTAYVFDSDTADFRLKSVNTRGFTLKTDNVRAHVDFAERMGLFQTNEKFSLVEFPENKYISRLDLFTWDMDEALLAMGSASVTDTVPEIITRDDGEEELMGPRYISVDPYQDSLSFVSNRAVYDYQRNILRGFHVTFLRVADAYIYPPDGEVAINPDGQMNVFNGARIIANRRSRLHEFYDANVQVLGKNEYKGAAHYDYINLTGEPQQINFHRISVDDSVNTYAEGMISESADFTLSPQYSYQGGVELYARKQFLTFDGGARIMHDCPAAENGYLKFRAEIDPENIYIPVPKQPLDINMNYIYSGIYICMDSAYIYSAFNGKKRLPGDRAIVTAEGFLHYDEKTAEYRISSREKLGNLDLPGNYLSLSTTDCMEYGEGRIMTGIAPGQVRTSFVGNALHNIGTGETELNVALGLNYFMSDEAFGVMAAEIDSFPDLEAVDLADPAYMEMMTHLVGKERAEQLQADLGLYGEYQVEIPEMQKSLFFTHIKLKWNQPTQSYRSEGKISLGTVNGHPVFKKVDGIIELQKKRSGDLLDVELELDQGHWYYFGYTRGVMHCLSSNRDFNYIISGLKTKQRKMKTPKTQVPYIFITATARKRSMFMRRFQEVRPPVEE